MANGKKKLKGKFSDEIALLEDRIAQATAAYTAEVAALESRIALLEDAKNKVTNQVEDVLDALGVEYGSN